MPCFRPITLYNRSHHFRLGVDSNFVTVGCGKCPACLDLKRRGMYLRIHAEFENTMRNNGVVPFVTLTYKDSALPWFDLDTNELKHGVSNSYNLEKNQLLCFDWSFIRGTTGYIKRVRTWLRHNYNITDVKYIICPEYGVSVYGTHRPHYHVLFFIPNVPVDSSFHVRLQERLLNIWTEDLQQGTASFSVDSKDVLQPYAKDYRCLKYMAKYCTKDLHTWSIDQPFLGDYLNPELDPDIYNERYQLIKAYLPMPKWSQHFGECLCDTLNSLSQHDLEQVLANGMTIKGDFLPNGVQNYYNIPRYIKDKILYDKTETTKSYTEKYRLSQRAIFNKRFTDFEEYLSNFRDNDIQNLGPDDIIITANINIPKVAAYLCIRGISTTAQGFDLFQRKFDLASTSNFINYCYDIYSKKASSIQLLPSDDSVPSFSSPLDAQQFSFTFNIAYVDNVLDKIDDYYKQIFIVKTNNRILEKRKQTAAKHKFYFNKKRYVDKK